jgi:uncharacterized damage-inducible protein DinB
MPEAMSEECRAMLASLNYQREHILGDLEGLSDDDLRRPVLPSAWTALGLVQHLALDVEQFWFRTVVAGEAADPDDFTAPSAWIVSPETPADAVLDLYRREIDRANAIITRTSLDTAPAWWPDFFGSWRYENLREVMLHVITETAIHAGHLDAVRELIDGRQWLVLTG